MAPQERPGLNLNGSFTIAIGRDGGGCRPPSGELPAAGAPYG
jgi:hypothetical protein